MHPRYTVRQATRTCWDVIYTDEKRHKIVSTHATKADAIKAASLLTNDDDTDDEGSLSEDKGDA